MNDVAEKVAKLKASPEYCRLKTLYADREWRLDNLYWIRNEDGERVRFIRNDAQRRYHAASWCRDLIPKARKIGFSTYIAIMICDDSVFRSGTVSGIVDRSLDDAVDKLKIVKFAYDNLPQIVRDANPLKKSNEKELEWANGSAVTVGTTYRGATPMNLHISEFGKVAADSPETAREIMTGAIQSVPASGRVWVESTAHGTAGRFYDMVQRATVKQQQKEPLTRLDFKLHFFGWWAKREYRIANNLVTISAELKKYFEELQAKHGIRLDADQRAFYAVKYAELGPDDVKSEFPSHRDELFYVSLEGAYWREEISRARRDGRIGHPLPHDPTRPVNTFWDIGENCTAVIFHQTDGVRHRFIDCWEEEGSSLQKSCGMLDDKRRERGFMYGTHYGPHDLDNREWGNQAQSRKTTALALGVKFEVVPRVPVKADSIEAARRMLALSWFDAEHCGLLVERLENYRKRWNKLLAQFMSDPLEDMNSHMSDAFQQGAMGLKPDRVDRDRAAARKPRSGWGA